jgi:hypothetical protein
VGDINRIDDLPRHGGRYEIAKAKVVRRRSGDRRRIQKRSEARAFAREDVFQVADL